MKKTMKRSLQKATAILLSAIMVLSAFAMMPNDLFKASASSNVSFDDRLELDFNNNWKFNLGDESGAYTKAYDDSTWETVELPHDFSISQDFTRVGTEDESGQLPGGTGWYRKTFVMTSDTRDKTVILNFDGSYKDTYVYVNGNLIGENHYGYNSFSFDISEYLTCNGETANIIAVKVENQIPSSRWYSGSGIYRDVTMTIVDPLHVDLYGTYVTTPNLESSNGTDGTVNAVVSVTNTFAGAKDNVTVSAQILDANGAAVGTVATSDAFSINGNETKEVTLTPVLSNPNLWNSWDLGSPYLYTLRTTVKEGEKVVDTYDTEFGYRWFSWTKANGFSLNGKNVKLEGVCMHHDQGALGSAQVYDAIYRQVAILKDMGCNAIRTSHGTPSDVFMDVCNELGMLVMNEFFDGWNAPKNGNTNDFSVHFDQTIDTSANTILGAEADQMWYEFVLTQSVKRDRNDPAVIIWDIGNEITEGASGVVESEFIAFAQNMKTMISDPDNGLDPTRPVCQGSNGPNESIKQTIDGFMDVIGGNYNTSAWISVMTGSDSRSSKPYVGTETASALSSRGHYSNTYNHTVLTMTSAADGNYDINSYDTSKVTWGAVAAEAWYNTVIYDWNSGEFVWTGFDYIGEPTPWNTTGTPQNDPNSSYFGIIDTAGFGKDTFYLYRSMWNEHSTTAHIVPGTWDSSELYVDGNGYVDVAVYTNADHIELLGDGTVIATAQSTSNGTTHKYQTWTETANNSNVNTTEFYTGDGNDLYPQFHVKHSAYNTLSVKAYDANGDEITDTVGTKSVSNVSATKIVASTWADASVEYTADGDSYAYIEYEAQDANGNLDTTYNGTLNITLNGNGAEIVGVDNGDQATTNKFQQKSVLTSDTTATIQMFNGKALAVVRVNDDAKSTVEIVTTAENATVNGYTITRADEVGDELIDEFEEVITQPENLVYEPTLYDEYEALYNEITGGGTVTASNQYVKYTATPDGTTSSSTNIEIPDGEYIISGSDDQGGSYSTGVITHTAHSDGGFVSDGSTGTPATTSDTWFFEKTTGGYYIYYTDDSGNKQYMTISNNQVYASTTPYVLNVTADANGNVNIGFGSTYINYHGGQTNRVWYWSTPTNLTLHAVTRTASSTTTQDVPVKQTGSTLESGEYIIAHQDGAPLTDLTFSGTISGSSEKWTLTVVDGSQCQIMNSSGKYLDIGTSSPYSPTLSSSAATLNYSYSNGTLMVWKTVAGDCDSTTDYYFINNNGSASSTSSTNDSRRNLNIYKVETQTVTTPGTVTLTEYAPSTSGSTTLPPVENGTYVIYNLNYIAGGETKTNGSNTGLTRVAETPSNNIIETEAENAYRFTLVSGTTNQYYIQNHEGKYVSMGSGNGTVTLSDSAVALTISGKTDGSVVIYNGSYVFDNFQDANDMFSCWSSSSSTTQTNQVMTLYRNESSGSVEIPAGKEDLYNALNNGIQIAPGTYSNATYKPFFEALQAGNEVFKDDSATADQITDAIEAIELAKANLALEYKYIPTTLWKYGYNPDATGEDKYIDGGTVFNTQTYESMKAIITADDDLMSQIKTAIGYDTATWASDTEKETALDTAVAKYAQIYSLSFIGAPVTNKTGVTDFAKTSWNVWCKSDTQAAGETSEEGASVQGLFSALRVDGQPTDHADYATLPYANVIDNANRTDFNTVDGLTVRLTINGSATDVTLPALNGIHVHINDMFKKEAVAANDTADGYSKYYWDLQFPLLATTNEYGINTYEYNSSSTEYVFQAEFDDANHTATAQLTPVDEWSINRDSKGAGTGFFPFNYQKGTTTYTGENAIYHYAFNYDMEFYIPMAGTYADGEDVVFEFSGDDDVLVYIDDVLVLDNGGLHGARKAAINFTDATVSYQYAMNVDAADGLVESTTENDVVYSYGQTAADGLNGDELAALDKLNEVRTDGDYHTFSFYFVERGSTDSNCEIKFNLQQSSEHVLLYDQTLVLDYGLPVEDFDITADNFISEDGADAGTKTKLIGVMKGNTPVADIVEFDDVKNLDKTFAESGDTLTVSNMKYGDCTVKREEVDEYKDRGIVSYTPNTIRMTDSDYFYVCSEVTDDPTYADNTVYHQYEKVTFIPATSVYYEDNFGDDISFTDGTTTDGSGNGVWETVGDASLFADAKQAADFAEDNSTNPYGFDPVYAGADESKDYTQYSGFSAQKVTVSAANNPKNGGTNPTVQFTFTGTGFDVVSVTDNTTGAFYVEVYEGETVDANKKVGKRMVVDTYYGYSYGQLYMDANKEATLEVTNKPLYKSAEEEAVTVTPTYFTLDETTGNVIVSTEPSYLDVSGTGYTKTPTYYDADGNLTATETEDIAYAYAYAYGWVVNGDTEGLYQIPVIKKTGLDYGTYTVVITPMYTKLFDNAGAGKFDVYIDAIRVYDPAGKDDGVNSAILPEYKYDNESYANYLSIKNMLIGADSLSKDSATQGVVFIDGIAALDNDLEKFKVAGPNNELYLAKDQAIAFEIWASAVPDEVQLGIKSVQGKPTFSVTYDGNTASNQIKTATEMNYIINSLLPAGSKLTWSEIVVDGVTYYRTGTVVIQNTSTEDSILSLTSMKWTFTGVGQYGHYESSAAEVASVMSFMASEATVSDAYTVMATNNNVGTDEDVNNGDVDSGEVDTEIIPGDNDDTNDTGGENQEELSWIQKIFKAITEVFKKIFSII